MSYATIAQVREYTELIDAVETPDAKITEALDLAKGFIDDYCKTTFEDPGAAEILTVEARSTKYLWAPKRGQWGEVTRIEYYEGAGVWTEYTSDTIITPEFIQAEDEDFLEGTRYQVTARIYTTLPAAQEELLSLAVLGICKLHLVTRDEPTGRSTVSLSSDGVSFSYRAIDILHPTGNEEIDYCLRKLRRYVYR